MFTILRRDLVSSGLSRLDSGSPTSTPILKVIIRAQPTLQRILKTLDADYAKIQVNIFYLSLLKVFILKVDPLLRYKCNI